MENNNGWCKFYSLSNIHHVDAIKKGYWYSTPPQYFNDIADCSSEVFDFKYVYKDYDKFLNGHKGIDKELQRKIAISADRKLIQDCSGITCFTTSKNIHNHLMWAHYAENHKGICLVFKEVPTSQPMFFFEFNNGLPQMPYFLGQKFLSVRYRRVYKSTTQFEKRFIQKYKCWKYEKESRLIQISPPFNRLTDKQRKIYFNKKIVSKVIIGKQFLTNDNHQEMLKVIKSEYPQAILYQTTLKSRDFKLSLIPVDIDYENNLLQIKK